MSDKTQAGGVYTDFQGLSTLRTQAREGSPEALKAAAKQFEAYLVQQLLQTSREASREVNPEGGALGDESGGPYEDMFDKQVALTVTAGRGLGVADLLVRQLQHGAGGGPAQSSAQTPAQAGTGAAATARGPAAAMTEGSAGAPFELGASSPAGTGFSLASALAGRSVPLASALAGPRVPLASALAGTTVPLASALAGPAASPASAMLEGSAQFAETTEVFGLAAASSPLAAQVSVDLTAGPAPVRFASSEAFVEAVMPYAKQVGVELGVDPCLLVAQAALETGWGRSIIRNTDGSSSHNLFNIKAHRAWDGPVATVSTREYQGGAARMERAQFRSYDSFGASFRDYVDFLHANPRYRTALTQTQNPEAFARSLQAAGYATDPSYADKVMRIYGTVRRTSVEA
jgi:peptidoglycan hydrolase FlgJ